jgi:aquaporin NIP
MLNYKRYAAEFTGTFCLIFCGTGAVIVDQQTHGQIGHAGVSAVFGLIVIAMIYSLGETSGAHINPAVTIGFTLAGLFNKTQVLPYLIAQLMGAVLASCMLRLLFPTDIFLGSTLPSGSVWQSFY